MCGVYVCIFLYTFNIFDNQGSKVNKNDIFLRFDILSFRKTFFQLQITDSINLHLAIIALVLDFFHNDITHTDYM